ncbi:hypothetical protein L1887_55541 [Cichorium endivia]|nr:hypothetical protein L1887_55541 [Cichorium endivia]
MCAEQDRVPVGTMPSKQRSRSDSHSSSVSARGSAANDSALRQSSAQHIKAPHGDSLAETTIGTQGSSQTLPSDNAETGKAAPQRQDTTPAPEVSKEGKEGLWLRPSEKRATLSFSTEATATSSSLRRLWSTQVNPGTEALGTSSTSFSVRSMTASLKSALMERRCHRKNTYQGRRASWYHRCGRTGGPVGGRADCPRARQV